MQKVDCGERNLFFFVAESKLKNNFNSRLTVLASEYMIRAWQANDASHKRNRPVRRPKREKMKMAIWTRTDSKPITTDSFVSVQNEAGVRGRVAVEQKSPGKVQLIGPVYSVRVKYDTEGTPESEERTVLDQYPAIDGICIGGRQFA
jgi:hypothetical protein